ncbi:MAG TPA: AbrB/MazE/SpoVT family DNA-binding domain-containing protein [Candidatus Binataceae bacterium]|nr:AbrB/MazE/SpoVT family DNA-binding domain-containing protein [Candidatus Binataceae bacterium]
MANMGANLRIDKAGRIVLPKPARDKLQLMAGDELTLESSDDAITLRPVRGTAQLRKKRGVWVFRCGEPLSGAAVQETLAQVRRERDDRNAGPSR